MHLHSNTVQLLILDIEHVNGLALVSTGKGDRIVATNDGSPKVLKGERFGEDSKYQNFLLKEEDELKIQSSRD